jgi:hypothetical protein
MRIERVCSWCGEHQGWVEWEKLPANAQPITHTICPSCFDQVVREMDLTEGEHINNLTATNCHEKENVK